MENKKDNFKRISENRVSKILNLLSQLTNLSNSSFYEYTDDEIDRYVLEDAINKHPLSRKPTNIRSKLAYKEILQQIKPTKKYLLPFRIKK